MVASIQLLRSLRRYFAIAMIVAYAVVMSGMPLPTASRPAKSDELFPCASCGCGCDSAERCWTNCCCHSLAERLAWAADHGVRPPEFALAEARTAGLDTSRWDGGPKTVHAAVAAKPCCAACKAATTPRCCSRKPAATRSCCANKKRTHDVIGWRALACHGQSLHWLAAAPTLIPAPPAVSDIEPRVVWLGPAASDTADGRALAPAVPPPERA